MKKNAMLKIAAILMVAVLLTTCAISSTFAKYVTTGDAYAEARVAKWGVDLTVQAKAFAETYGTTKVVSEDAANAEILDNVIAPGTKRDNAVVITATGTSEVATKVTFKDSENGTNFVTLTGWEVTPEGEGATPYCPVEFKIVVREINNETQAVEDNTYNLKLSDYANNVTNFQNGINETIAKAFAAEYAAGQTLNQSLIISWEWDYSTSEANDIYDTLLGQNAEDDNAAKIELDFVVSIEQAAPADNNHSAADIA